jgi:hypothetical protein
MGACLCSSEDSTCSSALGNCKNQKCSSSCSKKVQEDAVQIEEVVDAVLKKWIEDHLHKYMKDHLPPLLATKIEETLIDAINVDVIPRLSVDVIQKNASEIQESIKSPSI